MRGQPNSAWIPYKIGEMKSETLLVVLFAKQLGTKEMS